MNIQIDKLFEMAPNCKCLLKFERKSLTRMKKILKPLKISYDYDIKNIT